MGNFCKNCGTEISEQASFCHKCGVSLLENIEDNIGSDGLTSSSRKSIKYLRVFLTSFLMGCIPMVFLPLMFSYLEGKRNLMDINYLKEENIVLGLITMVVSIPAFLWVSNVEEKKRKRKEQMEFEQAQREKEAIETNRRILEALQQQDKGQK